MLPRDEFSREDSLGASAETKGIDAYIAGEYAMAEKSLSVGGGGGRTMGVDEYTAGEYAMVENSVSVEESGEFRRDSKQCLGCSFTHLDG